MVRKRKRAGWLGGVAACVFLILVGAVFGFAFRNLSGLGSHEKHHASSPLLMMQPGGSRNLQVQVHSLHPPGEHGRHQPFSNMNDVVGGGVAPPVAPPRPPPANGGQRSVDDRVKDQLEVLVKRLRKDVPVALQGALINDTVHFVASKVGETCSEACTRERGSGLGCDDAWFNVINECPVLLDAYDGTTCLNFHFGRDLPAGRVGSGSSSSSSGVIEVMINSDMANFPSTCDARNPDASRLCGCVPVAPKPTPLNDVTDAVAPSIKARLVAIKTKEAEEDAKGPRVLTYRHGHAWANYTGGPDPDSLLSSLTDGDVRFFTGERGETCYDVCKAQGVSCLTPWFETLNECSIMRAAFPEATNCIPHLYGRDLPAYRVDSRQALLNSDIRTYGPGCLARSPLLRRVCPCGFPKGGSTATATFQTVYNVQASRYFEWQVEYLHYWAKQVGQPGTVTRLLSANKMDHLSHLPTHLAPPHDIARDHYLPYNKPMSVAHWLKNAKPAEDIIIIIDPDCCFVHKVDYVVEEGMPIAQPAFYGFDAMKPNSVANQIAARYCSQCAFVDPIAVPVIIHRRDIEKIAPLWLEKTELMRRERDTWPPDWSAAPVTLGWTAEMFGYVFAAAELGIRHEIRDMQVVTPIHKRIFAPFIHYHVKVPVGDKAWHKANEDAATNIPYPPPDSIDEVTGMLITKLYNASKHVVRIPHEWPQGLSYYTPET